MAIDSVLNQTFRDFEFIIVDDGSTDGTPGILDEYAKRDSRIRIHRLDENQGIVTALNIGLPMCAAPLIARHDADDLSQAERLEAQKLFLDGNPEVVACGTQWALIDEHGNVKQTMDNWPCTPEQVRGTLKTCCALAHGSVMYRKDVILAEGRYSSAPEDRHVEDFEMWVRLAAKYDLANLPGQRLYFHRVHSQKIGSLHGQEQDIKAHKLMERARRTL
jgi:glycosyltransferase involved in cell wall biosynthesis